MFGAQGTPGGQRGEVLCRDACCACDSCGVCGFAVDGTEDPCPRRDERRGGPPSSLVGGPADTLAGVDETPDVTSAPTPDETQWLTLPDVAERLGVRLGDVRRMLEERQLVAVRRGERKVLSVPVDFLGEDGPLPELVTFGHTNDAHPLALAQIGAQGCCDPAGVLLGFSVEHGGDRGAELVGLIPRQPAGHPHELIDGDRRLAAVHGNAGHLGAGLELDALLLEQARGFLAHIGDRGVRDLDVGRHLGDRATPAAIAEAIPSWHEANRDVLGPDPDLIHPGVTLTPPPEHD